MRDRETRLMLEVGKGSREAFVELYDLFRKPLANFFYRLCWDPQKIDDLLQEVFLRVWRAAPKYEPRARVSTWLFQIAHNLWINESKKRRERIGHNLEAPLDAPPDGDLRRQETRKTVRRAVDALPEGLREVIVLAEYNGFKYQQISEILGIPVGTVKSRMFSATQRLREELGKTPTGE